MADMREYLMLIPAPWLTQQIEAECIATDDPRLKEK